MRNFFQNRIKYSFLSLLAAILFLLPISFSITDIAEVHLTHLTANAQFTDDDSLFGELGDVFASGAGFIWDHSFGAVWDALLNTIGYAILGVGSFFMGIGGNVLDYALDKLVFGMGEQLNEENLGNTVNTLWTLIRDICNLAFIFGFVYVGFMTIIDSHDTNTKKMLAQIIIGALLINFSLFFVKAIIDFSNFTSYKIYMALAPGAGVGGEVGISDAISQQLGVVTLWNSLDGEGLSKLFSDVSFWFFIFGFILLIVAAFSFFASAFLLISRFAVLILLMIGAPILFAATVFPQTKQYSEDMWKTLIGYSFYAPVYLLMILISIRLMDGILPNDAVGNGNYFANVIETSSIESSGVIDLLIIFGVCIFFMVSSISIAQKMSIAGGTMTVNLGNHFRKGAQGFVGRKFVGGGSDWALKKYDRANARNSRGWRFAKGITMAATLGALDDRTTRGIIESGTKAKFGSDYSYSDDEKYSKDREARDVRILKADKIRDAVKAVVADGENVTPERRKALYNTIRFATQAELIELLDDFKPNSKEYAAIVQTMKNSQYDDLRKAKDDNFGDEKKEAIKKARDARFDPLEVLNPPDEAAREKRDQHISEEFAMRKAEDISALDKSIHIIASQMDGAQNDSTKHLLKLDILEKILARGKMDRAAQQTVFANLSSNINNLSQEVRDYLSTAEVQRLYGTSSKATTPTTPPQEPSPIIIPPASRPRPKE